MDGSSAPSTSTPILATTNTPNGWSSSYTLSNIPGSFVYELRALNDATNSYSTFSLNGTEFNSLIFHKDATLVNAGASIISNWSNSIMGNNDAYLIDLKMDDGIYNSGNLYALGDASCVYTATASTQKSNTFQSTTNTGCNALYLNIDAY